MDKRHSVVHQTFHVCRQWVTNPGFVAGWFLASTITFPLEHLMWEKVWPFHLFTGWMEGLSIVAVWVSALVLVMWMIALTLVISSLKEDRHHHHGSEK